ncbi:MoaD/ThiS family protein [Rubrivirga sp. S365]|uniref:MoaD/ThiS family protein n=1 Tax=Rubrivirga litoralis TaxID=3075598 RepID=A0ABU3BQK1_9BACT|nr:MULTISPECIES: MoaD/ThiS family protein [unclassified Rubrivirga]MDT0631563.1 MoaD/ThiS family protein [Rubrivirga sp. F394]MDT7857198.1 MoaD/ThiS family protein [Rubrivirga sp. S365]
MKKRIDLLHFAAFSQARGCSDETVTTGAATPRDLYAELGLETTHPLVALRVAVNDRITTWDLPLSDGDHVVFLAPSSGG